MSTLTEIRKCKNCGKEFECETVSKQRFCCNKCEEAYENIVIVNGKKMKTCLYCGKLFEYDERFPNRTLCSRECREKAVKESPKMKRRTERRFCAYCGKPFIWKSSSPDQKYCSTKCEAKANEFTVEDEKCENTEERKCVYCGKKFTWYPSKSAQKYCSEKCRIKATNQRNENKKDMENPFLAALYYDVRAKVARLAPKTPLVEDENFDTITDYWDMKNVPDKIREEVLKRDMHECQICRNKENLDIHHIVKIRHGGTNQPENLITLCSSCHRHIETGNVPFAVEKCYRNAKRFYFKDIVERNNHLPEIKMDLEEIFKDIKNTDIEESESILIELDDMIESILD